jgi:50S ribosomal subunit-associated GTPase HflX
VVLGTRKYTPCLYVYNKIDSISLEEMDKLARRPHSIVVSCEQKLNLDRLLDRIWVRREMSAEKEHRSLIAPPPLPDRRKCVSCASTRASAASTRI